MRDFTTFYKTNGDLRKDSELLSNTEVYKASNLCRVEIGSKTYCPTWGIALSTFINENFEVQNSSFTSYLTQRMAEVNLNVAKLTSIINHFSLQISVGFSAQNNGGMIA